MNLRDLHYIVAVADLKHFSKAAEACHISQPSLSMQIRKVEEELSVTLFERTNKQVLVTPEGHAIIARARQILALETDIRTLARQQQNPLAGTLRLGIIPTIAPYIVPRLLPALRKAMPALTLELREAQTHVLVREVQEGAVEIALLALPLHQDGLTELPLYNEPFLVMVPHNHALASKKSIRSDDLHKQELLLLEDGHCLRDQALEVCHTVGAQVRTSFRGTSLETIRRMVEAEQGITLIPQLAIDKEHTQRANYIPFSDPAPFRQVGLLYRNTYPRDALVQKLANVIMQIAQ